MKQLFSILFSVLILTLATKELGIYVSFKLNQTFIANNWCVNINNPKVNCCGKCFLKNELKESQESKQSDSKFPSIEEITKNYYYTELDKAQTEDTPKESIDNFGYELLKSQLFNFNFLDPPEVQSI